MQVLEHDPYRGRRRAYPLPAPDGWPLAGVVLLAVVSLSALTAVMVTSPPRPPAPTGLPGVALGSPVTPGAAPSPSPSPSVTPPRVSATRGAAPTASHPAAAKSPPVWRVVYEAEAQHNVVRWRLRVEPMRGASQQLGVSGLREHSAGLLWFFVCVPRTATYRLTIYFQNPDDDVRTAQVNVNRDPAVAVRFRPTGTDTVRGASLPVRLSSGADSILLTALEGRGPDIDRIEIVGGTG